MKVRCWIPMLLVSLAYSVDTPAPQQGAAVPTAVTTQRPTRPMSQAVSKQSKGAGANRGVSPSATVISLDGVCQASGEKKSGCKTAVTRAQLETLMNALPGERGEPGQPISPQAKRQFAMQYSRLLTFAAEAERLGLHDTPEGRALVQYARLQALAQALTHQLQGTSQPTLEEMKDYYTANQQRYVELTLQRVFVPVHQVEGGTTNEAAMRVIADDLYKRAANAKEFSELQAEANERADIKNPPESLIVLPATAVSPTQQAVLQLKVGELSQVIQDGSGFSFYRLDSTKPVPFEAEVKEIQDSLTELKVQQQIKKLLSSSKPVLSPQYFQQGVRNTRGTITIPAPKPFRPTSPVNTSLAK